MSQQSTIKKTFIDRSWIILAVLVVLAFGISYKILRLQTTEKEELLNSIQNIQIKSLTIPAKRGNIYASDGSGILATSTLEFRTAFDPSVAKPELFNKSINGLAEKLSKFFKDNSSAYYKEKILAARKAGLRYLILNKEWISFTDKEVIEGFPLFKEGSLKGGGFFEEKEFRFHPYNSLAERTIGNLDANRKNGATGIEAEFNNYLKGVDGSGVYERLAGNHYKPVNQDADIAAVPGQDVVSTLDVNFQDMAESALRNQLLKTQANYGSVVIMEVETGEVKAITNLKRYVGQNGESYFLDNRNYAVMVGTDPGSTFKLASMLAILEKSDIQPTDFAVDCRGNIRHNNLNFTCSHAHGKLNVEEVFEKSCNVGIYALMRKTFGFSKSNEYYSYLEKFRLTKPTGFQLKGEEAPLIKNADSKSFSSTTIPWMSIGYESRITPLQMLVFYNAVANNGHWVQPLLVKEIRSGNVVEKTFTANKPYGRIASESSIKAVQKMMKKVVLQGTAKNIKDGECTIAGKTGTAQKRVGQRYSSAGAYYTSFIGYFPTHKPKYSCVVVIDEPKGQNVYGGDVCAPVFRIIADKVYAYDMGMHKTFALKSGSNKDAKAFAIAKATDQVVIAKKLGISSYPESDGWVSPKLVDNKVVWKEARVEGDMQNLVGLTLKDAIPILENKNYKVRYSGLGRVSEVEFIGGRTVKLLLR